MSGRFALVSGVLFSVLLAIVAQWIVQAITARSLESRLGVGSNFSVAFPAAV
jgi:hypothetical protein